MTNKKTNKNTKIKIKKRQKGGENKMFYQEIWRIVSSYYEYFSKIENFEERYRYLEFLKQNLDTESFNNIWDIFVKNPLYDENVLQKITQVGKYNILKTYKENAVSKKQTDNIIDTNSFFELKVYNDYIIRAKELPVRIFYPLLVDDILSKSFISFLSELPQFISVIEYKGYPFYIYSFKPNWPETRSAFLQNRDYRYDILRQFNILITEGSDIMVTQPNFNLSFPGNYFKSILKVPEYGIILHDILKKVLDDTQLSSNYLDYIERYITKYNPNFVVYIENLQLESPTRKSSYIQRYGLFDTLPDYLMTTPVPKQRLRKGIIQELYKSQQSPRSLVQKIPSQTQEWRESPLYIEQTEFID